MDAQQEQEFDNKIVSYIGIKLMRIGNFMLTIGRIGGYITAAVCVFNYHWFGSLLNFTVYNVKAQSFYRFGTDEYKNLEYYDIDDVNSRTKTLLTLGRITTVFGGATVVCGAIGAAAISLGNYLCCKSDLSYLYYRSKKSV